MFAGWAALRVLVVVAFGGAIALRLFGVAQGRRAARHWRIRGSWSAPPCNGRVFMFIAVWPVSPWMCCWPAPGGGAR